VSANTEAQNPVGSVIPPLSFAHTVLDDAVDEAVLDAALLPLSLPLPQALRPTKSNTPQAFVKVLVIRKIGMVVACIVISTA
jgi:hypothetical protein